MIDIAYVIGAGINIRVGAQPLMHLPAKQFVNRLVGFLADNVPARHFERAQDTHQRQVGMLGKAARIDPPPQRFDVVGIIANRITRKHILDHFCDKMRRERHAIGFTDPRNTGVGRQLDEHEITPAEMRRWIADNKRLDVNQLHAG